MKVKELTCTIEGCPTEYFVMLEDGRMARVKFRWGQLSITLSKEPTEDTYTAAAGELIYHWEYGGDGLAGIMDRDTVVYHLTKAGFKFLVFDQKADYKPAVSVTQ